jgi:hypothetical protein
MQKLSGKRIDKFYKSCRVLNQESDKIKFVFFWIFYGFLCILQVSGKRMYYLRNWFSLRSLETFNSIQKSPRFADFPSRRLESSQCGPRAPASGGSGQNSGDPPMFQAGEVEGEGVGLTRDRFACLVGVEGLPARVGGGARRRRPLERLLQWVERCRLRAGKLRGSRVVVERGWWAQKIVEWGVGQSSATASNGAQRRPDLGSGQEPQMPLYAWRFPLRGYDLSRGGSPDRGQQPRTAARQRGQGG